MKKLLLIVSFLLLFVGVSNATQPNNTSVAKLYVATFDRAPDSAGLDYWVNLSGLSLEEIATSFFDQPETKFFVGLLLYLKRNWIIIKYEF